MWWFFNSIRTWRTISHTRCPKKGIFWNASQIMLESDLMIYQKCILNYGRIKSSDSESTFFGTPCILLFVIANCFLLLATSLQAPSTLLILFANICQLFYKDNLMTLAIAFNETQYSIYSSSSLALCSSPSSHLPLSSSSSVSLFVEVNFSCQ